MILKLLNIYNDRILTYFCFTASHQNVDSGSVQFLHFLGVLMFLLHQTMTSYNRNILQVLQVLHILLVTSVTFYCRYTLCCILILVFSLLFSSLLVIFETFDFKRILKLDHARVFYNFKTHNTTRSSLALFSIHQVDWHWLDLKTRNTS